MGWMRFFLRLWWGTVDLPLAGGSLPKKVQVKVKNFKFF
jgi:hypothetical protein